MHRVVVVGSPRSDGKSASLGDEIFNACIEECPDDGVSIVSVSSVDIAGCNGCNACRVCSKPYASLEEGDPLEPCEAVKSGDAALHRCVIADDMDEVRKHLDAADELIVVSPVFFSGVPSQFKALLDRLQPYFWSDARSHTKRPLVLHVIGEGGDPHGFDGLIGEVRSAFAVAGFRLELILNWVGKIAEDGDIIGEPEEYPIRRLSGAGRADRPDAGVQATSLGSETKDTGPAEEPEANSSAAFVASERPAAKKGARPKLSVRDGGGSGKKDGKDTLGHAARKGDAARHGKKKHTKGRKGDERQ